TVSTGAMSISFSGNTATVTFPGLTNGVLDDGNYHLSIAASGVSDTMGSPLINDVSLDFFVLAADANRDRTVNILDFNILATNYNQTPRTFSQGDFNYDSTVNVLDFNILASRYGTNLPPAAGAAPGAGYSGNSIGSSDSGTGSEDDQIADLIN